MERSLKSRVLRRLAQIPGSRAIKLHGSVYSSRGEPDVLFVCRAKTFFFELKTPKGKVAPIQAHRLEQWANAGAVTAVVTSIDELDAVLRREGVIQ